MSSEPLLSVIIPNWNGKRFLEECMDSLKGQTFQNFETILVDNGSIDDSVEFAERHYGDSIRVIRNSKNLGFTGGNNVGIQASKGEYIVLLNNDTWADPRWLEELAKARRFDPPVGMWASKVCSYYQRDRIEGVGELIYWDGLCRARGQYEQDHGQYNAMEEILFPPGCGAMYRKSLLDEIGLFDEDFFTSDELFRVLGELPRGYRMIFNLYAVEGYKHKEIAEMMGIDTNTSKSQYSRARAAIRDKLEKLGRLKDNYPG